MDPPKAFKRPLPFPDTGPGSMKRIRDEQVDKIIDKKSYKGRIYYLVKWADPNKENSWQTARECFTCRKSVAEFDEAIRIGTIVLDESLDNEWQVKAILGKRLKNRRIQYLLEWDGWPNANTWEYADDCNCHNLIAAFENPKLEKLWNWQKGGIVKLWLNQDEMLKYMRNFLQRHATKNVTLLKFKKDFPLDEQPLTLRRGVNIGPLLYENHWYLVIFIVNFINIDRRILIGDALNTLVGTKICFHPVHKRISRVYNGYQIKAFRMTQMERSDVCAFYTLAAFERAMEIMNQNAHYVPENLYFEASRAELIRTVLKPESHGAISYALPLKDFNVDGPQCEFCSKLYTTRLLLDEHIMKRHMTIKEDDTDVESEEV